MDETFRIYLLSTETPSMFGAKEFLESGGCKVTVSALAELWGRYVGFDGRTSPTHDVSTGFPLRRGEA